MRNSDRADQTPAIPPLRCIRCRVSPRRVLFSEKTVMPTQLPPHWDDLRLVLAIVRRGSFQAAAPDLGLHHSSITRRVSALEKRLGVKLFRRDKQGAHVTADGQYLASIATSIEQQVMRADRNYKKGAPLTGDIRISMPASVAHSIIKQNVRAFHSEHPNVRYCVTTRLDVLRTDGPPVDLAVVYGGSDEAMLRQELGLVDFALYRGVGSNVCPKTGPWIHFRSTLGLASSAGQWIDNNVAPDLIVVRTDDFCHYLTALVEGGLIGILPRFVGGALPMLEQAGKLIDGLQTKLALVTHHSALSSPQVSALWHYLAERATPDEPIEPTPMPLPGIAV